MTTILEVDVQDLRVDVGEIGLQIREYERDGEPFRGSIIRMGSPYHILGLLKEIREKIGKSFGDEVEIVVEEDVVPREVVMPLDLLDALKGAPETEASFARLSFTHQKEYAQWIEEAKREQTKRAGSTRQSKCSRRGIKRNGETAETRCRFQ